MLVALVWPNCEYWGGSWSQSPIDGFFVGFTLEEFARWYPQLPTPQDLTTDDPLSPASRVWMLISRDGKRADKHAWFYPVSHQWNADSPFVAFDPPLEITDLLELASINLPKEWVASREQEILQRYQNGYLVSWDDLPDAALVHTALDWEILRDGDVDADRLALIEKRLALIEKLRAFQLKRNPG